jgi:hypothetical protein
MTATIDIPTLSVERPLSMGLHPALVAHRLAAGLERGPRRQRPCSSGGVRSVRADRQPGWPDGLNALLSRSPTRMRQAKVERVLAPDPVQAPASAPAAKQTSSTTP